jgi:threonine/homoserine/homoserine lactone efflux protein
MEVEVFIKGIILGFFIAAPVGPIGVLCIHRTLKYGRFAGFFSGLGAAVADSIYATIAAFGLTFISKLFAEGEFYFQCAGGLFLIYLGWKTFFVKTSQEIGSIAHITLFKDFSSTFFLTITNPMTILTFLAVFAGFGLSCIHGDHKKSIAFILGVFLGSSAWWFFLSEGVSLFRRNISQKVKNRLKLS